MRFIFGFQNINSFQNAGPIRDHIITINSNRFLEMGKDFLPTGKAFFFSLRNGKEISEI